MDKEKMIQGLVECATATNGNTININNLEKLIEVAVIEIVSQKEIGDIKDIIKSNIMGRLECYKITHPNKIPIEELEGTLREIVYGDSKNNIAYTHTK